jgi:prophage DNA circulation protein
MADILKDLKPASFRGIEFFVQSVDITGGRKTITHEYPNSNTRFVEDIGLLEDSFSITGIISEPNYFSKKQALKNALDTEGTGILINPFGDSVLVALAEPYTISENKTNLGVATFTMTFRKASRNIFPTETVENDSLIVDKANEIVGNTEENLSDNLKLETKNFTNFTSIKNKLTDIADYFETAKSKAEQVASKLNDFDSKLIEFRANITELINTPTELSAEITGLYNTLNILAKNPIGQIDMFRSFFDFGNKDTEIMQTTSARIERAKNQQLINEIVLVNSLSLAYQNIVNVEFTNTNEIDDLSEILETQYDAIADNVLDTTTFDNLQELRKEARIFFDRQRAITYRVTQINTNLIPATVLTYDYYGNLDNWEQILSLNDSLEPAFLEGNINILTR